MTDNNKINNILEAHYRKHFHCYTAKNPLVLLININVEIIRQESSLVCTFIIMYSSNRYMLITKSNKSLLKNTIQLACMYMTQDRQCYYFFKNLLMRSLLILPQTGIAANKPQVTAVKATHRLAT